MNHYCTYFDRGFLIQGLTLWRTLSRHDETAELWVLALDDFTAETLKDLPAPRLHVVRLREVEAGDEELAAAKSNRSAVEYCFTLSPCWPRWLLRSRPEIDRVTYLDADMAFFASPQSAIFDAMTRAGASVLIAAHRFHPTLSHYERHGKFNVGVLCFRRDAAGLACLDQWRAECLAWCHDRLENGRYADQKYLDTWPDRLGRSLLVLGHAGVNLAPWNWTAHRCTVREGSVRADGQPLVLFHFARFRPQRGTWWWHSGQLDYGVMPWRLRNAIYRPYVRELLASRDEIRRRLPEFDFPKSARRGRDFGRTLALRIVFGSDWLLFAGRLISARWGLGRWSGRALAALRRWRLYFP